MALMILPPHLRLVSQRATRELQDDHDVDNDYSCGILSSGASENDDGSDSDSSLHPVMPALRNFLPWQLRLLPLARARVSAAHAAASADERLAYFAPPHLEVFAGEGRARDQPTQRGLDGPPTIGFHPFLASNSSTSGIPENGVDLTDYPDVKAVALVEHAIACWEADLRALVAATGELRAEFEGLLNQATSCTAVLGLGMGLPDLTGGPRLPPVARVEANLSARRSRATCSSLLQPPKASAAKVNENSSSGEGAPSVIASEDSPDIGASAHEEENDTWPLRLPGHGLMPRLAGLRKAIGAAAWHLERETAAARQGLLEASFAFQGEVSGRSGRLVPPLEGAVSSGLAVMVRTTPPPRSSLLLVDLRRLVTGWEASASGLFVTAAELGYAALATAEATTPEGARVPVSGATTTSNYDPCAATQSASSKQQQERGVSLRLRQLQACGLACRAAAEQYRTYRASIGAHARSAFALAAPVTTDTSCNTSRNYSQAEPAADPTASAASPSSTRQLQQAVLAREAGVAAVGAVGALRRHYDTVSLQLYRAHAALDAALTALAVAADAPPAANPCSSREGNHGEESSSPCIAEEASGAQDCAREAHRDSAALKATAEALRGLSDTMALVASGAPRLPPWVATTRSLPTAKPRNAPCGAAGSAEGAEGAEGAEVVDGGGADADLETLADSMGDCWAVAGAALRLVQAAARGEVLEPACTPSRHNSTRSSASRDAALGPGDVAVGDFNRLTPRHGAAGDGGAPRAARGEWASPGGDSTDGDVDGSTSSASAAARRATRESEFTEVLSTIGGWTAAEEAEHAAAAAVAQEEEEELKKPSRGQGGAASVAFTARPAPASTDRARGARAALGAALVAELGCVLAGRAPLPVVERRLPGGVSRAGGDGGDGGGGGGRGSDAVSEAGTVGSDYGDPSPHGSSSNVNGDEAGALWRRRALPRRPGGPAVVAGRGAAEPFMGPGEKEGEACAVPPEERERARRGAGEGGRRRPLLADFLRGALSAE